MSLMERLLKTLRYNFLTEALDFVGVHQERTLQVTGCQHPGVGAQGNRGSGPSRTTQKLLSQEVPDVPSPQRLSVQNLSSQWEGKEQAGQVPDSPPPSLCLPSQCLSAVRTVQSLACLEEADHTVGFILQLSNFMKEWHFHLPQLLRDVQVGP